MGKDNTGNHYLKGRQVWSEAYGEFINSRNNWRMTAMVALLIAMMSMGVNIVQVTQSKVVPYVIEVDKANGLMRGAGYATPLKSLPKSVVQGSINSFIKNWRTVTADISLQKSLLQQASFQVAGSAKGTLGEWYSKNNPYERGKKDLVTVQFSGVPLVISGNTWQVEWTEIVRTHAGITQSETSYQASVQIQVRSPETEEEILRNPSGVYATALSWTKKVIQE